MVDITDYPNPLLTEFNERFPFATAQNVTSFILEKLQDETNLQRLNSDGTLSQASVKVLYDGRANSLLPDGAPPVFNSVIANDFSERLGSEVGTIDRTKLGQFLFRSKLGTRSLGPISIASWRGCPPRSLPA